VLYESFLTFMIIALSAGCGFDDGNHVECVILGVCDGLLRAYY
jgi:hypothetical protein